MKLFRKAFVFISFCLLAAPSGAEILVFRDGRTMKVSKFFFLGDTMSVELPGGGKMDFAADRVEYIAPDEIIPEEASGQEIRIGGIQVAENRGEGSGEPADKGSIIR